MLHHILLTTLKLGSFRAVSCSQVYYYYTRYSKDTLGVKLLVRITWILYFASIPGQREVPSGVRSVAIGYCTSGQCAQIRKLDMTVGFLPHKSLTSSAFQVLITHSGKLHGRPIVRDFLSDYVALALVYWYLITEYGKPASLSIPTK